MGRKTAVPGRSGVMYLLAKNIAVGSVCLAAICAPTAPAVGQQDPPPEPSESRQVAADEDEADAALKSLVSLLELVIQADEESARQCLQVLSQKIQTSELSGRSLQTLRPRLQTLVGKIVEEGPKKNGLYLDAVLLAASMNDPVGKRAAVSILRGTDHSPAEREKSLKALVTTRDPVVLEVAEKVLAGQNAEDAPLRAAIIEALGRLGDKRVADVVLKNYATLSPELQAKVIELLTQRAAWSRELLKRIGDGQVSPNQVNANQVRRMLATRDEDLQKLVGKYWGTVRTERSPQREKIISEMRDLLATSSGDPHRGEKIFHKLCGQCHTIYGKGQKVGPDITANGRASFEQLLSNVFDPSLVIGAAYQARTVVTNRGRLLTGLMVEDNEQRVVLAMQGGKQDSIPRDEIDEVSISKLSLMPEGLEKQLKPPEIVDLFAFLLLDRHPDDPQAKKIP